MNSTQLRQTLWLVAAALVTFVAVRRWRLMMAASNSSAMERFADEISVPLPARADALRLDEAPLSEADAPPLDDANVLGDGTTVPPIDELVALEDIPVVGDDAAATDEETAEDNGSASTRKVSSNRRITYQGHRYGPLPETLVGQQVHVAVVDNTLQTSHDGEVVASFLLHQPE